MNNLLCDILLCVQRPSLAGLLVIYLETRQVVRPEIFQLFDNLHLTSDMNQTWSLLRKWTLSQESGFCLESVRAGRFQD